MKKENQKVTESDLRAEIDRYKDLREEVNITLNVEWEKDWKPAHAEKVHRTMVVKNSAIMRKGVEGRGNGSFTIPKIGSLI